MQIHFKALFKPCCKIMQFAKHHRMLRQNSCILNSSVCFKPLFPHVSLVKISVFQNFQKCRAVLFVGFVPTGRRFAHYLHVGLFTTYETAYWKSIERKRLTHRGHDALSFVTLSNCQNSIAAVWLKRYILCKKWWKRQTTASCSAT